MRKVLGPVLLFLCFSSVFAQSPQERILINQVGFYPDKPKMAVIVNSDAMNFAVKSKKDNKTVFRGKLSEKRKSPFSDKYTKIADFSAVKKAGTYYVEVPALGKSYSFEIRTEVHKEVAKASIKGFYFQRLGIPLEAKYAGQWARPAGNPDTKVYIHGSAATEKRPEGTKISSPGGWLDAGDYNKYIVNSGITMGTLLSLYEDFPAFSKTLDLNIPESGNKIPDLLDEVLWNLRWMLTMQDPEDGGVYNKLTNPGFDGMIMPHETQNKRYVVQKGTAAALDFAAVTAQASRVFKAYETALPGLSDSCLKASQLAWKWAKQNPALEYNQDEMNKTFAPKIVTGGYGDKNFLDEWSWAAAELLITTGDKTYYEDIKVSPNVFLNVPSWPNVQTLAYYSMSRFKDQLSKGPAKNDIPVVIKKVTELADRLTKDTEKHYLNTPMGKIARDFSWGSSSVAANQGVSLIQAYQLTKNELYLNQAIDNLDYLMGRNGTAYNFLTGFGSKKVMHPHHRPSIADGVNDPVPGLLSGGPNPGKQDKCTTYTSDVPDECFTDDDCSYASNEIAINWNAPMAYLAAAIEALNKK